ncbi:TIGR01906 family membrane protein [Anaerosacchariphilus polymeriproducens]|uniref:TIGR01906 family membrane protein n=1 Tax=Anaerosacchariphilus polymeriproducens TaxID=1812858 RepID=A0A371ASW6_9FIRM|nr:TIGR01906 family membrane protein [Anaerosacchariphilus polymeriproducens]RDU22639.1 TIGR01906 family membrane protein [Anaerosacchariphilus polymeriproducens]
MEKAKLSNINIFTDLIIGILFTLFFMSAGVILVLNLRPIYYFDISLLKIEETSGMEKEEIVENYNALIDYNSPFYRGELNFPTLKSSETGLQHFKEVKRIFISFYYLFVITGLILIPFVIYKKKKDCSLKFLRNAAILIFIIPVVVGIAIALNFNQLFILFHKIFFRNDYWIFSIETDPVIGILPDTYFLHCAVLIILVMMLSGLALYFIYKKRSAPALD